MYDIFLRLKVCDELCPTDDSICERASIGKLNNTLLEVGLRHNPHLLYPTRKLYPTQQHWGIFSRWLLLSTFLLFYLTLPSRQCRIRALGKVPRDLHEDGPSRVSHQRA
jgi:hypothetical protein